jgi:hypothetical protein
MRRESFYHPPGIASIIKPAGGPAPYHADAVHLPGNAAFYTLNLLGAISSPKGTFFCWYKTTESSNTISFITSAADVSGDYPQGNATVNFYMSHPGFPVADANPFVLQLEGAIFDDGHFGTTANASINDGTWKLSACSWDTDHVSGQKICQILLGSTLQTVVTWEDSDNAFSTPYGPGFVVGAYTWTGSKFDEGWVGDLSDIYLDITTNVDLSNPSVVAKISRVASRSIRAVTAAC